MYLWAFWWCIDDHIATAVGMPGVGQIPFWVMLIVSFAFNPVEVRLKS